MITNMKRFAALLLALVMIFGSLPAGILQVDAVDDSQEVSAESYVEVDAVFDLIDASESGPAKKNAKQEEKTADAMAIVMESESYVEGSLEQNGDAFTWWTDDGVRCVYSPRMREIDSELTPENACDEVINEPVAIKGGYPTGNQVYLVGPYYGYDDSFTDQYKNEAKSIASAIGDTDGYTLYSGKSATVDKVADAVSNGAVVFFDSHGMTDYEKGNDFVTGATSSFLCLTSTTGLTSEDYNDGALYYSDGICINGATIANHMTKKSPSGILWMAICLGMATDTMCEPMREMGVEVVYGYSQSVTFAGDYLYEETFWDAMTDGKTVAESVATMKSEWGNWDWSTQIASYYDYNDGYSTISSARADYAAFPVVVSDEDDFPGQRNGTSFYGADSLQTVKSTYTLFVDCEHIWSPATCSTPKTCTECGRTDGNPLPHTDANDDDFCDVCGADTSQAVYTKVTSALSDWSGKYLIVYEDGSVALDGGLTTLDAVSNTVSVTISNNAITLDPGDDDFYVEIDKISDGYSIKTASGYYIGHTGTKNTLASSTSTVYAHSLSLGSDGATIQSSTDYVLRFNNASDQMRFRYYKSGQQPIALYKLAENVGECQHVFTSTPSGTIASAATCTAPTQYYVKCDKCDFVSNTLTVESGAALGHAWINATCTAPKTCSRCEITEGSALGHTDNNGDKICDTCGANLSIPVVTGNTYVKVTESLSDWSGKYLIVYEAGSLALDGGLTTLDAVSNTVPVTISNNAITLNPTEDNFYVEIAKISDGYSIKTESGYYIGHSGSSNTLKFSTTTVYSHSLDLGTSGATIQSGTDYVLRFNNASNQMRFRYYKSGQQPVALYKLVEKAHEHSYVSVVTEPTCTEDGYTTYTCACGDTYTGNKTAATGHSYNDGVVTTEPTYDAPGEMTYTCSDCGATKTEEIPQLEKPAVTGTFARKGLTLSLSGLTYMNLYVTIEGFEGIDIANNGGMLVWNSEVTEAEAVIGTEDYHAEGLIYNTSNKAWAQQTNGIVARMYADTLYIRMYVKDADGNYYYSPIMDESVREYCEGRITNSSDAKMVAACTELLHYGAAAQVYKTYKTDDLANKNISAGAEFDESMIDELVAPNTQIVGSPLITKLGATLTLGEAIRMNLYVKPNASIGTLVTKKMYFWQGVEGELTLENATSCVDMLPGNGGYGGQTEDVVARGYGDTIYGCAYFVDAEGNEYYSEVYNMSPEQYALGRVQNSSDANMVAVAKALVVYGEAAKAYLNK